MAGRTGLRYEGVLPMLALHAQALGIEDMSETVAGIQVIERAVLEADAEAAEAKRRAQALESVTGGMMYGHRP